MKAIDFEQGTQEWHAWRNARLADGGPRIMASDLPAIMGVSPYETTHQLWMRMTGRAGPKKTNRAMQRGHEYEPVVRARLEESTGTTITPLCCEPLPGEPAPEWAACSLDGLSDTWDEIHEIKVPGAKAFQEVLEGRVPEQWMPQIQWQLLITGVRRARLTAFDPGDGVISDQERMASVMVFPDSTYHAKLVSAATRFRDAVMADRPLVGDDLTNLSIAWLKAYDAAKKAEDSLKAAQAALLAAAPEGERVDTPVAIITRAMREGTIDYARLLKDLNVDEKTLESYRKLPGKPTITVRRSASADAFMMTWEKQLTEQAEQQPASEPELPEQSGILAW
jgi:putative phage-type endonuclease